MRSFIVPLSCKASLGSIGLVMRRVCTASSKISLRCTVFCAVRFITLRKRFFATKLFSTVSGPPRQPLTHANPSKYVKLRKRAFSIASSTLMTLSMPSTHSELLMPTASTSPPGTAHLMPTTLARSISSGLKPSFIAARICAYTSLMAITPST